MTADLESALKIALYQMVNVCLYLSVDFDGFQGPFILGLPQNHTAHPTQSITTIYLGALFIPGHKILSFYNGLHNHIELFNCFKGWDVLS